jgi:integrase
MLARVSPRTLGCPLPRVKRRCPTAPKALKPDPNAKPGTRKVVWDAIQPNLCARVTDKGRISFVVVRRPAGAAKIVWTVLGTYPTMSLADARRAAREALAALSEGKHPNEAQAARRQAAQEAARQQRASTFESVAELFIKQHLPRLRSGKPVEALIRTRLVPALGDKRVGEIRRRDIIELVEDIARNGVIVPGRSRATGGGEYAARHALAALSKLFNWAVTRDIEGLETNPCSGIKIADLLGPAKARDRVLSDDELRLIWQTAEEMKPGPIPALYQVLMLTGQRLREISDARWSEIDLDNGMLTIPAERMKGKAAHSVPLTPAVIAVLRDMPRYQSGDFIFSTTFGKRPVSGFSKSQDRMRRAVEQLAAPATVPHWQIHDIRRSVRTGLSIIGATPFVAEQVIGHRQTGVHAVYDLHKYDAEKRDALMKWEARLLRIVGAEPEPTQDNVVTMPAKVARV